MTQAPQPPRDWQKDMDMFEEANKAALTWLVGKESAKAGVYWIQEAKRLQESFDIAHMAYEGLQNDCVSRGEYESLLSKHTAKAKALRAAEAREKRLKEALKGAIAEFGLWNDKGRAAVVMKSQLEN